VTGRRVLLATRNPGKVEELRRILGDAPIELVGLADVPAAPEVAETGDTFVANSLLKALGVARATGLPAVADDSGLAVDALGGMPGVWSAHWAGRHGDDDANLDLLLAQLAHLPADRRSAAFVCAAAAALPAGDARVVQQHVRGRLLTARRGTGGFGYDPVFVPDGHTRTTAEMAPAEKDDVSHRGRAFRALVPLLVSLLR
jgi:XTP/dITP diphosphohydrolase